MHASTPQHTVPFFLCPGVVFQPQVPVVAKLLSKIAVQFTDLDESEREERKVSHIIKLCTGLMGDLVRELGPQAVLGHMNITMPWVQSFISWTKDLEVAAGVTEDESVAKFAHSQLQVSQTIAS